MPCQKSGALSNSIVTVCKITLKIELLFIYYYSISLLFILFLQCPAFRTIYVYNVPHLREQITSEEWENRTQSMYNTSGTSPELSCNTQHKDWERTTPKIMGNTWKSAADSCCNTKSKRASNTVCICVDALSAYLGIRAHKYTLQRWMNMKDIVVLIKRNESHYLGSDNSKLFFFCYSKWQIHVLAYLCRYT